MIPKMKNIKTASLILFLLIGFNAWAQSTYYVAPDGQDSNAGTLEAPFATIAKALDAINGVKKSKENYTVSVRGGLYQMDQTLAITNEDSAPKKGSITIKAYENEEPVFSGAVKVGGFEAVNKKLWKKKIKLEPFRNLYIGQRDAIRAREPNLGSYYQVLMWDRKDHKVIIQAEEIENYMLTKDMEMRIHMNWAENIFRLQDVQYTSPDKSNWTNPGFAKVSFKQPEDTLIYTRNYPPKRRELAYQFENSLEFVDADHEWYYDQKEETLYIQPNSYDELSTFEVWVPQLETLVDIKGTIDNPVKDISIEGLTFIHNNWNDPSEHGYIQLQAGNYNVNGIETIRRIHAAIQLSYARNITFKANTFQRLSSSAIDLFEGVKNSTVTENVFFKIGGSGVMMAHFSDGLTDIHGAFNPKDNRIVSSGNTISNNLMRKVGITYLGCPAINIGFGQEITIKQNDIADVPWVGIHFGWGWNPAPSAMRNNRISKNRIGDVCNMLCDCGGIYTLSNQEGSIVNENYIYDISRQPYAGGSKNVGLYADEGSTGILFKDNFMFDVHEQVVKAKGKISLDNNFHREPWIREGAGLDPAVKDQLFEKLESIKL